MVDRVAAAGRLAAVAIGVLHGSVAAAYQLMNPDGIVYLDIAEAYVRGDLTAAINPVWSPLYSWVLAPVAAAAPPPRWEFPLVHLVNVAIYLAALGAFEFFWLQAGRYARLQLDLEAPTPRGSFPAVAWRLFGYALFTWVSIHLITVASVTPDLLMSALLYLAAGLVVRVRLGYQSASGFAALGVVLGLAYLAKSVMFLLAPVIVAMAMSPVRSPRRAVARGAVALACFLVTAGPFVLAISQAKGRPTFGEAGRLTYLTVVNRTPYPHWQGDPDRGQVLPHHSRKIFDHPAIFEFGAPIAGTYPIGYDSSYWYEGAAPRFDPAAQLDALQASLRFYTALFLAGQGVLVLAVCLAYAIGGVPVRRPVDVVRHWGLAVVALAALGLYALVLVEGRYVGAFLPLLWGDLLASVRLPGIGRSRLAAAVLVVAALWVMSPVAGSVVRSTKALSLFLQSSESERRVLMTWPDEVAASLHRLGVPPGSNVAVIGYGFLSYWARLARVRIVAEMFGWDALPFWNDADVRANAIRAFARTGASAIVAEEVFTSANLSGWHRVGSSDYYIYLLE